MLKKKLVLIVIILVSAIIDWRISVGIIVGYPFSLLHSWLLKARFSSLTTHKAGLNKAGLGLLVLAMPMLISMLLPQYVHFIGVFIGLIYEKYSLYVQSIRNKG